MLTYLNYLMKIGIDKDTVKKDIKKIKVLNYCVLVGFVNAVFFLFIEISINQLNIEALFSYAFQIITYVLVFIYQKKKKYFIGRLLFLILSFSIIFYNNNYAYQGFYGEYMLLFLPLVSLFFFDHKWIQYSVLLLCILSFYLPNMHLNIYPDGYFGYLNGLFLFIGSFVIVSYFKSQNKKNENSLEKAYAELEEQKKGELAHLQLKSLKAQMNPHFMFNAMNSIQNLVLRGDKHEAYNYLTKFSTLIRENLNMSEKSFVSFDEELSLLKKYLDLEALRFRENFEYKIIGIENISNIKIPSMFIQPFVENSIKHGLLHKINGKRKLTIEFIKEDLLKCIITDNGIGIQRSTEINALNNNENSFSTAAIKNRLSLLKEYYKLDLGFEYEDVKQGTKLILKIPFTIE